MLFQVLPKHPLKRGMRCALRSDAERFFISDDEQSVRLRDDGSFSMTLEDDPHDNDEGFYAGEIAPTLAWEAIPSPA